MKGYIVGPVSFHEAENLLARLIERSNAFHFGANPVIGRLKTSGGFQNIIGVMSFDNKVYTRIDYDDVKGFHFHFVDDNEQEKVCILIHDMTRTQYQRYIRTLTLGRSLAKREKRQLPSLDAFDLDQLMEMAEEDDSEEFPLPPPSVYYDLISERFEVVEDIKPRQGQQKKKKRKNQG